MPLLILFLISSSENSAFHSVVFSLINYSFLLTNNSIEGNKTLL